LIEAAITYFEAETQEARAEALKDLEVEREAVWRA
jgi:hypothetical protein